ncbi:PHP domain-containing protein [Halalkalibacter alkalisediminis]|uniref:PHP domain-containing protein n=1 Tax=Halalkalibacter alkalisediminis TaxID=935616 RepID=A0ABV6NNM9_9BACI|nr:PHP domain-containing protein [Halalkalibacter alkalisediminis]
MNLKDIIEAGHFDLHVHTKASDGDYSPTDVVKKAKKAGLKTIAITDHDTLEGIAEAQKAGKHFGIQIIPAIELSTKYKGKSVDILGYNITVGEELKSTLLRMREGREERAKRIIEKFNDLGFILTLEDVKAFSEDGVIARPHIAKAVVKKGYISDYQTVFDDYLADDKPCAIDKIILSPKEGIRLIHEAGGEAVLAHPVYIGDDNIVRELLSIGFDGIEVWHRSQNKIHNKKYKAMAEEFELLMTGGSDFHSESHQLGRFGME